MRENIKKDFGLGGGGVQGFRAQLTFHFSLWVDDHSSVVCTDQMGGGGGAQSEWRPIFIRKWKYKFATKGLPDLHQ